jgi:hypothetical protein
MAVPDATANRHAAIRVTGSLDLRSTLNATSLGIDCPSGAPSDASCRARADKGLIRGLGSVTATYVWYFTTSGGNCPSDLVRPFATPARIVVAGKGEIHLTISPGEHCVDVEPVRNEPQAFTITGGSGAYDGATGSGLLERNLANGLGTETLTGTLTVPASSSISSRRRSRASAGRPFVRRKARRALALPTRLRRWTPWMACSARGAYRYRAAGSRSAGRR